MKKIYLTLLSLAALSFTSQAQVDLSIGNIDAGFTYNENTGVLDDIYFTMLSNENGGASNFKIGVYFAPLNAQSLDDCYLLESTDAPSISGNSSRDVTGWKIEVNNVSNVPPSGTYRLLVSIDIEDDITETNENNNSLYISEQGENLKFTRAGGPSSVSALPAILGSFTCFPNPATNHTTVSVELNEPGTATLRLLDATGKEVLNVIPAGTILVPGKNEVLIDLSALPKGVYICVVQTAEGAATRKIVKY